MSARFADWCEREATRAAADRLSVGHGPEAGLRHAATEARRLELVPADHVRASLRYMIEQEDRSHDAYRATIHAGTVERLALEPQAVALLESLADACAARSMAYRVALALLDVPADDPGPMSLAASLAAHEKGI